MKAVVLAGERSGGGGLARELGLSASVLVEVAGIPSIVRVIETLRATTSIDGGTLVGPDSSVCRNSAALASLLATGDYIWVEPAAGPAESTLRALADIDTDPVLVTTGDHALLTPAIVAQFLAAATTTNALGVVGLVRHEQVMRCFPGTRRTRLRFLEGGFCGANLFLLRGGAARALVSFWADVQRDRKRPWRIAARLGLPTLVRYWLGGLAIDAAFARLSELSGCSVAWVTVEDARAAVDIDTSADLAIAEQLLAQQPSARQRKTFKQPTDLAR